MQESVIGFDSHLACVEDLRTTFERVAPQFIDAFGQEIIDRNRVDELIGSFRIHANYFKSLQEEGRDESVRIGGLHICKGIAGWFGTTIYTEELDRIPGKVQSILGKERENIEKLHEFLTQR